MESQNIIFAFAITIFAGLATGIGSAMILFAKRTNVKFLSVALGFSAGVMIYLSFVEIFFKGKESLIALLTETSGTFWALISFFGGMLLIAIIDKLVPTFENPHSVHTLEEVSEIRGRNGLARIGILTAVAIAVHNFPEGLATFTAAMHDPNLGVPIALAVAIHNIPEGIAVYIPIYYGTGSKKKAFLYSFLSGLSEPVGAIGGYMFFRYFFNELTFGITFTAVAGIMIFISLDQLLPASEKYGEHHLSIYGLLAGMFVMAASLFLFIR